MLPFGNEYLDDQVIMQMPGEGAMAKSPPERASVIFVVNPAATP